MLRRLKLAVLSTAAHLGVNSLVSGSEWRRARLLVLCYHGIALQDEHQWRPALYLNEQLFRRRMQRLNELDCAVLPLGEALAHMYAGTLPKRAVAITFDDGAYDFYSKALPVLRDLGFPATVYLTTHYSIH